MAVVEAALEHGHEFDPLGFWNKAELGDGRLASRAAGSAIVGDDGLAFLEDGLDVVGPDFLHEDGDGDRRPEVELREDLREEA